VVRRRLLRLQLCDGGRGGRGGLLGILSVLGILFSVLGFFCVLVQGLGSVTSQGSTGLLGIVSVLGIMFSVFGIVSVLGIMFSVFGIFSVLGIIFSVLVQGEMLLQRFVHSGVRIRLRLLLLHRLLIEEVRIGHVFLFQDGGPK